MFCQISHAPSLRLSDLSATACLGERQLRRVFAEQVGMGPKQILRIHRFRRAVQALLRNPGQGFDDLLYRLGYTDHSHFNREFHALAGLSPSAWLRYLQTIGQDGSLPAYRGYHDPPDEKSDLYK